MHSAGWLEGGLVSCYEKFIVDIELLRELRHEFTPLEIDEASLAFDAHTEVGAGGHFLGAAHTLERFRECFYRPLLSSTENFDRWTKKGAPRHDRARRRDLARDPGGATSSRRSTTRSTPSSRSSWCAGAPSSATELQSKRPGPCGRPGCHFADRACASRRLARVGLTRGRHGAAAARARVDGDCRGAQRAGSQNIVHGRRADEDVLGRRPAQCTKSHARRRRSTPSIDGHDTRRTARRKLPGRLRGGTSRWPGRAASTATGVADLRQTAPRRTRSARGAKPQPRHPRRVASERPEPTPPWRGPSHRRPSRAGLAQPLTEKLEFGLISRSRE